MVVVLAIGVYFLFTDSKPAATPSNPVTLPTGSTRDPEDTQVQITLRDGSRATVPDFSRDDMRENASPEAGYEVSGADIEDFQILYFPEGSYFLISLQTEPLSEARFAAEQALRQEMGLSTELLCKLNYEVRTSYDINPTYAGGNLGMSFCPGATRLP